MNKRKKQLLIRVTATTFILLLLLFTTKKLWENYNKKKVTTKEGIELIKKAESADITAIENKIAKLDKKDSSENGAEELSLKERFGSTVVVGDSLAEGFYDYDVLNSSSVVATVGISVFDEEKVEEQIQRIKEINPQYIFLNFGTNDIEISGEDVELFLKQYQRYIEQLKKELPNAKILVDSIFPVKENVLEAHPKLQYIDLYNQKLQEFCDKQQIAYVDNTNLVGDKYYAEDGIHMVSDFYFMWAEHLAEVAEL